LNMEVTMPMSLHSMFLEMSDHEGVHMSGLFIDVMRDDIECWKRLNARWRTLLGPDCLRAA
jgi:hypothetical protein